MYKFEIKPFGQLTIHKLINTISNEFVEIIPDAGVNINNLCLSTNGVNTRIINGAENYQSFLSNKIMFEGSKLFPWAGRIPKGQYYYQGLNYQLDLNSFDQKNAIHGFIYDKQFKLDKVDEKNGKIQYIYIHKQSNGYPHPFQIIVEFHLSSNGLSISTLIKNTGVEKIPIADGWHPYFLKGINTNSLQLKIPSSNQLELNNQLVPTGKILKNNSFYTLAEIGNTVLDACFKLPENTLIGETILRNEKDKYEIRIWQEAGQKKYNYIVIFTPETRKSIAIEPWTSPPNSFNDIKNLLTLNVNEELSLKMGIQLSHI